VSATAWQERLGALQAEALPGGLELRHAHAFGERRRGLAGLDLLPPDVGLRIHRCNSVHTFGMRFALDLVWLARDGRVLRLDTAVPRRRQRLCVRARSVVEVAAGEGERWAAALHGATPGGPGWSSAPPSG
jgi:uncharacterized membrane protein (UPF0127 family)